jgi:hypothetical protein
MTAQRPVLTLAPVEFGYGPLGKALHIARALRDLAGDEVRLHMVATENFRSPIDAGLFDSWYPSITAAPIGDAAITIMNVNGIGQLAARGERIYVVDSLAWLWDAPLPVGDGVRRYFYQDLPVLPVPGRNLVGLPEPTPVPAIGELPRGEPGTARTEVVISLSGIEAPGSDLMSNTLWYPPYVLDSFEQLAGGGRLEPDRTAIFGNPAVLRHFIGPRLSSSVRDGMQAEFGRTARRAGMVLCPPGLTTIVECLRAGIALRLLPPQNYSQVKLAQAFSAAAGIPALGWGGPVESWLRTATLPEVVGADIVRGMVAARRLTEGCLDPEELMALCRDPAPALGPDAVVALLGAEDGATTVARTVLAEITG